MAATVMAIRAMVMVVMMAPRSGTVMLMASCAAMVVMTPRGMSLLRSAPHPIATALPAAGRRLHAVGDYDQQCRHNHHAQAQ